MSSMWTNSTIGELCDQGHIFIQTGPFGSQLHAYDYQATGVPVIPTEAIGRRVLHTHGLPLVSEETAERLARHRVRVGDILFARRGVQATGFSAIVQVGQENWICGTGAILLRSCTGLVDPQFLSFWLASDNSINWLKTHAVGAVMPNLNESVLRELPVVLPPLPEQRAIAAILGALDDKIELNRRMNETLEQMAQALFKSWFVDFDPVHANRNAAAMPGLAPNVQALFPSAFEDSVLGEIPQGWLVSQIADISQINERVLSTKDLLDVIEYIEISEVAKGNIANIAVYSRGEEPSRARRIIRHGDTVLSTVRPERGSYFLVLNPSPSLIVSTGFAVISPKKAPWSFIHTCLTRREVFEYLGHLADGGAYPAVSPNIIGSIEIPVADQKILESFSDITSPIYERMEANRSVSRTLAATRDALLPKLLSGEVRVREAEKIVEHIL